MKFTAIFNSSKCQNPYDFWYHDKQKPTNERTPLSPNVRTAICACVTAGEKKTFDLGHRMVVGKK